VPTTHDPRPTNISQTHFAISSFRCPYLISWYNLHMNRLFPDPVDNLTISNFPNECFIIFFQRYSFNLLTLTIDKNFQFCPTRRENKQKTKLKDCDLLAQVFPRFFCHQTRSLSWNERPWNWVDVYSGSEVWQVCGHFSFRVSISINEVILDNIDLQIYDN